MDVTPIDAVLLVDSIVEPKQVFAIIQRVWLLEGDVVGDWAVRESGGQTNRGAIDIGDRAAVGRDSIGGNDVAQRHVRAAETSRAIRSGARLSAVRIAQQTVVVRAHDSVCPPQAKREIAV